MSGRHQPEQGADSPQSIAGYVNPDGSGEGNWAESIDRFDEFCTYCLSSFRRLRAISLGGSTSFLCNDCFDKQQVRYRQQTGGAA
jgi:hypothetical protein